SYIYIFLFFFSSRRRHTISYGDWSSDVCSSDLVPEAGIALDFGREALREIKSDPSLRDIPVVVLTTSKAEEDIARSYNLGVNSRSEERRVEKRGQCQSRRQY